MWLGIVVAQRRTNEVSYKPTQLFLKNWNRCKSRYEGVLGLLQRAAELHVETNGEPEDEQHVNACIQTVMRNYQQTFVFWLAPGSRRAAKVALA